MDHTLGQKWGCGSPDWESIIQRPRPQVDEEAVAQAVMGHCVMITGASGSLGSALSDFIASYKPGLLVLFDWHESSMFRLRQNLSAAFPGTPVRYVLGDIRNRRKVARVMAESAPDVLFHLAAYKQLPWAEEDPAEFLSVNVFGSVNMIDEALKVGVRRFVYPSTDKAVLTPSLYGATKKIVEELLRSAAIHSSRLKCGIVRFVNVLGSQGSVSETFVRQAIAGESFKVTHPQMDRYWITPAEATLALVYAACLDDSERVVIPDAGEAVPVTEIAARIWREVATPGSELKIEYIGLREGERLHEELTAPGEDLKAAPYSGIVLVEKPSTCRPDLSEMRETLESLSGLMAGASPNELKRRVLELAHSLG